MSGHTKKHPIRNEMFRVTIELPNKKRCSSLVPKSALTKLENFLKRHSEKKSISWEKLASDRIAKHSQSGLALRGARVREGLSQVQLAKKTGISQENLSKMENGKRSIGEKVAKKLTKALRIDIQLLWEK